MLHKVTLFSPLLMIAAVGAHDTPRYNKAGELIVPTAGNFDASR